MCFVEVLPALINQSVQSSTDDLRGKAQGAQAGSVGKGLNGGVDFNSNRTRESQDVHVAQARSEAVGGCCCFLSFYQSPWDAP